MKIQSNELKYIFIYIMYMKMIYLTNHVDKPSEKEL